MKERVRNSVKAVIISGGKILLLQKMDALSLYTVLPGGGQKMGEALPEALRRECLEEINARASRQPVEIGLRNVWRQQLLFGTFFQHFGDCTFTIPAEQHPKQDCRGIRISGGTMPVEHFDTKRIT